MSSNILACVVATAKCSLVKISRLPQVFASVYWHLLSLISVGKKQSETDDFVAGSYFSVPLSDLICWMGDIWIVEPSTFLQCGMSCEDGIDLMLIRGAEEEGEEEEPSLID